jgi:hypothetical protein
MKSYHGHRNNPGGCVVRVIETDGIELVKSGLLDPRLDLSNHSPTGFEWGYGGSGPAQLALAILADALGDARAALALHQGFKFKVIAALDRNKSWELYLPDVLKAAVEVAEPCALLRDAGRIFRICGDCGRFLQSRGMANADEAGVLDIAPGYTAEQVGAAAKAHHGKKEGLT